METSVSDLSGEGLFQSSSSPGKTSGVRPVDDSGSQDESLVNFSKHAATRLKSRGIILNAQDIQDLSEAIDRLESKNARESLLLLGEHAFIVGVPKRTVITAMTRREAVGSIFTNIDSTLVVR
jgi:flagellar operon protein